MLCTLSRSLVLGLCLVSSAGSYAFEVIGGAPFDYLTIAGPFSPTSAQFGSVGAACEAGAALTDPGNPDYTVETTNAVYESSGNRYKCYNRSENSSGAGIEWMYTYAYAHSCSDGDPSSFCQPEQTPEVCREAGTFWDSQTSACVASCALGSLDHYCMYDPVGCNESSPDYLGTFGPAGMEGPVCSGDASCPAAHSFGTVNGENKCIADDYGPPSCSADMNLVLDEAGWVCYQPNDPPQVAKPDSDGDGNPNADTDGDGIPDATDPDVDGDGNANESDSDYKGQKVDNSDVVAKLDDMLNQGETDKRTQDSIRAENRKQNKYLDGIDKNTKDINDALSADIDTSATEGVPTVQETSDRIRAALSTNTVIAALTSVPSVASSTACPTWQIPANEFWNTLTIDAHCAPLENNRGLLSIIFMAMWTLIAVMWFIEA